MNRRDIMLAAAGSLAGLAISPPALAGYASPGFAALVYDGRYEAARRLAQDWSDQALPVFDVAHDAAAVWYAGLGRFITQAGGPVAGLTSGSDRLVLQGLARDRGLVLLPGAPDGQNAPLVSWRIGKPQGSHSISSPKRRLS